jgi:predicted Zn-dependent protease
MSARGWIAAVLVGLLCAGCATVPLTGRRELSLVPESDLVRLAAEDYKQLINGAALSTDPGATAMVERVGRRVAAAAELLLRDEGMESTIAEYDWEFHLIEDPETANAFCMPGGKIAVYSGILPVAADETGLAVVVGHEVAHAVAHHGAERMSQLLVAELGGEALAKAIDEKPEETRRLLMLAYGVGANVGVLLPYSRAQESEADRIGLVLMARAGYDPRAAVTFWERMLDSAGSEPPEFLSTHPTTAARIEDIELRLPEALSYYKQ